MEWINQIWYSDALNEPVADGLSLFFVLLFYGPLLLVAGVFFVYGLLSRRSILGTARVLGILWLVACVPAVLMMLMGYAFNPKGNILVQVPVFVGLGWMLIRLPVWLRMLFRVEPV